jgi:hypothetical protein
VHAAAYALIGRNANPTGFTEIAEPTTADRTRRPRRLVRAAKSDAVFSMSQTLMSSFHG